MIDDELLAKFDRIQDLPVSEEMLGAYLENSLDDTSLSAIEGLILNDESIQDILNSGIESDSVSLLGDIQYDMVNTDIIELPDVELYSDDIDGSSLTHQFNHDSIPFVASISDDINPLDEQINYYNNDSFGDEDPFSSLEDDNDILSDE